MIMHLTLPMTTSFLRQPAHRLGVRRYLKFHILSFMISLEEISISNIKGLIPSLLYKKLVRFEIRTVQGVIDLDIHKFSKFKGIGTRAVTQLFELQKFIKHSGDELLKSIDRDVLPILSSLTIDSKYLAIEFSYIEELMPRKLLLKLSSTYLC